jgi:hypothetical protein
MMETNLWLSKAQTALRQDPTYSKAVVDEWWQSVPMPDVISGKPVVVFYAGPTKRRSNGGRSPAAPALVAVVSYPDTKVIVQQPPPDIQPTAQDDAKLDDPEIFERVRKNLATRGHDIIRHQELVDIFLQKGWWAEHNANPEHRDVAHEWDQILSRILLPNYEWLNRRSARFLREWISRNR